MFEQRFAECFGVKYAYAVSTGAAAIHCALAAASTCKGDEGITTVFTFIAPVKSLHALGAKPVLVEIGETYHLDPKEVEKAIMARTKAVVSVPMWASLKMDELQAICRKADVMLIEDAAQCLGGSYKGKKLGTLGKIESFSYDMGKSITTGEGGIIITVDRDLYDCAADFSGHGHMHVPRLPRGKDPRRAPGFSNWMHEITGLVGLAQMVKLEQILTRRKENECKIKDEIKSVPGLVFRPFSEEGCADGDTLIIQLDDEDKALQMAKLLEESCIGSKILPKAFDWHYAGAWNPAIKDHIAYYMNYLKRHLPKTHQLLGRSIAPPFYST